ncbi:MAG: hypothetical protein HN417_08530 [Desulfobacula sp.]|jgi:hypothetical protein|nr:hypothetical protein [Desulfobacula sp.]MBT6339353.1 hypothetical protein [Desulfobacula sp.]MBT7259797.1 hypothetical protein [Desulfobacula sp.]
MLENKSITGRYVGLFLFGCFLFSYPVLTLFNLEKNLFGIPLFFFYIFTAWSVLILFIIFCGKIPDTVYPSESDTAGNDLK